jgi:hypothetical protein
MRIDLLSIDAGAGEALLRKGDGWLLLSLDAEWQAVPLRGLADAVRWSSSSLAIPVGRSYEDLDQVVTDVREASLVALRSLLEPGGSAADLLPREASYRPPLADERRQARAKFLGRAMRRRISRTEEFFREIITAESGCLERCLERWGYTGTEVLELMALCFDRLFADPAGWVDEAGLKTRLFALAEELHWDRSLSLGRWAAARQHFDDRPLEQLVDRRIAGLSQDIVESLAAWTDLDLGHWEVQVILQFSPEELEWRLRQAARAIGLAAELLRVRLFAPACRRAAEGVLARRRVR